MAKLFLCLAQQVFPHLQYVATNGTCGYTDRMMLFLHFGNYTSVGSYVLVSVTVLSVAVGGSLARYFLNFSVGNRCSSPCHVLTIHTQLYPLNLAAIVSYELNRLNIRREDTHPLLQLPSSI